VALLLSAAPALALVQAPEQAKPAKSDPDRIICEKIEQIGSRLATRRVCMTAAQWAEKRRLDREELQTIQAKPTRPN
jgi:hypothetical protein